MSKVTKERGISCPTKHASLHAICKKSSHTGAKPLVPHINDENVMVTQKVRKAQERNKNRNS